MRRSTFFILATIFTALLGCKSTSVNPQNAPNWITNLEKAYPSKDWIAVTAQGTSQQQAEDSAMNALARAFNTNVASITQSSQRFSEIIDSSTGKKSVTFNESKNFSQDIQISNNVKGLIGVQIDVYRSQDKTVYACARMNRRECARRYSAMIRENTLIINGLVGAAATLPEKELFGAYARLNFAHAVALVTDNFNNLLAVLDPTTADRRPGYGGANAIKTKMLELAAKITIGVNVTTEQAADKTLLTRAAGSFFKDMGFKTSETTQGNYTLRANARFETVSQNVVSCRYYLDASLENPQGVSLFSFTEDDRKAHPNSDTEARRLAVRAAETSFKEGKFANEFNSWLNSLLE